jgi:predicted metal-dependent phosphoesterase TrpH
MESAAERHPHLAERPPAGWVRVDCHSHTMWSGDATTTPDEVAEAVEAAGIDILCITDHGTINGAVELAAQLPCRVVVGEELRTHAGEVMGLFLTERLHAGLGPVEAATAIRDQGGLVYIPHPFDPVRHCLREPELIGLADAGLVDVVEVFNAKTSLQHLNRQAGEFARQRGLAAGAGSDAHVAEAFGAAYLEMPDFDGPQEFMAALGEARVVGHHFDRPRPWRPRIVPSTRAT